MLFKFKSKATGDLIMLEPHGRRLLQVLGKDVTPQGIIQVTDLAACIDAIENEIAREAEQARQRKSAPESQAEQTTEPEEATQAVSFKNRALPMLDMLRHCLKAEVPIVWGV